MHPTATITLTHLQQLRLSLFVHRKLILVLAEWPSNIQSGWRIILSARAIFRPPFVVLGEQRDKGPDDQR